MNDSDMKRLLEEVAQGTISVQEALDSLDKTSGIENLGFARLDTSRKHRTGMEEVIFAPGKTLEQLDRLVDVCLEKTGRVLVTRIESDHAMDIMRRHPSLLHNRVARTLRSGNDRPGSGDKVAVVSAGTSDQGVAEEASVTLEHFGHTVTRIADVGVAGLHRLMDVIDDIQAAKAVIVVAGMEGALPSVVAGLVRTPVVAVPTSIGYGASFHGVAALLGMLNSCAGGVGVVNIDNGFGAALLVHRMMTCKNDHFE